ncbi:MAG: hypothetical protein KAV82_09270 [Phycisphaerae bacterium]|nr:hypothetical protein [Phycisphaerae bacterium]
MTDQHVLDILNDLLAAIEKSPQVRLTEAGTFVSSAGTKECIAVEGILEEERQLAAELAGLLIELGGSPAPSPGSPVVNIACFHYLDVHFMLPEFLCAKQKLVAACESVLEHLADSPEAHQLITRIAMVYRDHIARLQPLNC